MISIKKPCLILCDIEGTTTSITFVKDCLFPYVRKNVKDYLFKNIDNEETLMDIQLLWEQYEIDKDNDYSDLPHIIPFKNINANNDEMVLNDQINSIVDYVNWLMDYDRKVTSLKQLQGHIWRDGYNNGNIKGHIYDDVPIKFKEWIDDNGIVLGIYSSGSVFAQRLLFKHTTFGDLTKYISHYFDTNVGGKQEADSYRKIVSQVNFPADNILFLTDVSKEAKAAIEAGLMTVLLERDGTQLADKEREHYPYVKNFNDINFI